MLKLISEAFNVTGTAAGRRLWNVSLYFLALVGLLVLLIVFTPFGGWYAGQLLRPRESDRGDILIVLSAPGPNKPVPGSDVMDISTCWRCFMALLYYRQHPYRLVLVSGEKAAAGMKDFFVFNGVPAETILVEDRSTNTHENTEFSARMLAGVKGRLVLVTSDYHIYRARRCFAKAGLDVSAVPAMDYIKRAGSYSDRLGLFLGEIHETVGIVYYWYRGWI